VVNLVVAIIVTLGLRAGRVAEGVDATRPGDYHADEGSDRIRPMPEPVADEAVRS
jgi:SSS family solute:Na+ symporter